MLYTKEIKWLYVLGLLIIVAVASSLATWYVVKPAPSKLEKVICLYGCPCNDSIDISRNHWSAYAIIQNL